MPNTTHEQAKTSRHQPILDWDDVIECEYCGAKLPMRKIPSPLISGGFFAIGRMACACEGAQARQRELREKIEQEKREQAEIAKAQKLNKSGIPPRYRDATHPYAEKMAKMAIEGRGFYIHGPNGTLKTTLAMSAGLRLLDAGKNVLAIASYDLMDAMRSRKDEDRELFDRAASCDVLILDDLGKEASNTAYACERLFAIIDKRDKALLPIIITTNYKLSEIAKKITEGEAGVAIASRLSSTCTKVHLDGEDRRLANG